MIETASTNGYRPPTIVEDVAIAAVTAPANVALLLLRSWRAILTFGIICGAVASVIVFSRAQRYSARATVAAIGGSKSSSLPGGLASSLLGPVTGVQATPVFVGRLIELRGVLDSVALHRRAGVGLTVVERLKHRPLSRISPDQYAHFVSKTLQTSIDRESGTVTVTAVNTDSSLAREIVDQLLLGVRRTFGRATKSQGAELREAQTARVDSATSQLHHAEESLVAFNAANRAVPRFSTAWVEQQRLQRAVTNAQDAYSQAANDLQSAIGKELEETPAIVVLDSVPAVVERTPRRAPLFIIAPIVVAIGLAGAAVIVREAASRGYAHAQVSTQHAIDRAVRLPVTRGRVSRWFLHAPDSALNDLAQPAAFAAIPPDNSPMS